MEEQFLVDELQQGKESAYLYLVETYRVRVFNLVLNILQDEDDADDTAQEAFIQLYHSIHQFKKDSTLGTWIYRIAVRKALDKLRQRKNRQRLLGFIPWWMPKEGVGAQRAFYHPGIALENKEKAADLFKAINALPEKQKIAFSLIKVEGLSYLEAGDIMGQSVKAVESLISRAKQNLQERLQQYRN